MNYQEFSIQMNRLTDTYGDKYYPQERVNQLWRMMAILSVDDFEKVVTAIICEFERAPMVPAIQTAARTYIDSIFARRRAEMQHELSGFESCRWCKMTGILMAQSKENEVGDYAFRCPHCQAARVFQRSEKIPLWHSGWLAQFWPRYGDGFLADPFDMADPAKPGENTPYIPPEEREPEPIAQTARALAIVNKALAGKQIIPVSSQETFDI